MKAQAVLLTMIACIATQAMSEPSCLLLENTKLSVYFPHPTDCSKFLTCHWGNLVELSCPNGTLWNDSVKACDLSENVVCSPQPESTTEDPASTTTESATLTTEVATATTESAATATEPGPSTTESFTTITTTPSVPPTNPSGKCPEFYDPDNQVYLPHADCTKYYICTWGGVALEQQCPPNLHWNQNLSYCDYPAQAGCSSTPQPTSSPTTTTTNAPSSSTTVESTAPASTTTSTTETAGTTTEAATATTESAATTTEPTPSTTESATSTTDTATATTTPAVSSTSPSGKCPELYDPDYQVYLPHVDCTKYYICTWGGVAVEQQCPPNLHWNQNLSYCDFPAQAGCSSTSQPTSSPTTTTTNAPSSSSTLESTTPAPTTTSTSAPSGNCPNVGDYIYFPHPTDCSKFLTCEWGNLVELTCPNGTLWNDAVKACDLPGNVVCSSKPESTTADSLSTNSESATTNTESTTTTTESSTLTPPPAAPSFYPSSKCPEFYDLDHQVYLPHADCTKFYICTWGGVAVEQQCPANLHWNQNHSYCDYPELAGCSAASTTTQPATTPALRTV